MFFAVACPVIFGWFLEFVALNTHSTLPSIFRFIVETYERQIKDSDDDDERHGLEDI
jgi:hypothetical protein